jgi:excisionase family DNA binding protein
MTIAAQPSGSPEGIVALDMLLTLRQAAERLGISPATLRAQVRNGRLHAIKPGHDWLVEEEEIERYRRENLGRGGAQVGPARQPGT